MKLCLFCKHFSYSPREADWSEYTPGEDASFWCELFLMPEINLSEISLENYKKSILKAKTCEQYQQIEIEEDKE